MRKKLSTFCKLFTSLVLKWPLFKLKLDIQPKLEIYVVVVVVLKVPPRLSSYNVI